MNTELLSQVVIVDACRTPFGRYGGALSRVRPDDLAVLVIRALLERNPALNPAEIEDVLLGCANQAGEDNRNVARMAALLAGLPVSVPGGTVNRLCGSGLMAINQAAQAIAVGEGDLWIAGGVESMSRAPWVMAKPETGFPRGEQTVFDSTLGWRFTNPALAARYTPYNMGETAENVADRDQISRADQDAYALDSQQKAQAALANGAFDDELIAVPLPPDRKGRAGSMSFDEHPKADTTLESLAALRPAFRDGGSVTAGNSSGLNDGAAAVLLMTEAKAKAFGLNPLARIRSMAVAGVDPATMGLGPIPATQKALARAGLTVDDLDIIELNEAFAVQSLACIRALQLPVDRVNIHGGAIALGHPLGASGARIAGHLAHALHREPKARFGLATMCIGVGQGIATILERVDG